MNIRHDHGESMGNQISFLPVVLPLDLPDPLHMLQAVGARMEIMKSTRTAELVAIAGMWVGRHPSSGPGVALVGVPLLPLPLPLFNIICTNIPGCLTPLRGGQAADRVLSTGADRSRDGRRLRRTEL